MVVEGLDEGHFTFDDELQVLVFRQLFREVDLQPQPRADVDLVFEEERRTLMADIREDRFLREFFTPGV